ncbi:hypothetical protein V8G54_030122 [Vigna mungo]|uniref:Uncharacterized protein n=1 Tax=Vigna mungo TaxID=3915 RepID=A0AAQ3MVR1_VIGMU
MAPGIGSSNSRFCPLPQCSNDLVLNMPYGNTQDHMILGVSGHFQNPLNINCEERTITGITCELLGCRSELKCSQRWCPIETRSSQSWSVSQWLALQCGVVCVGWVKGEHFEDKVTSVGVQTKSHIDGQFLTMCGVLCVCRTSPQQWYQSPWFGSGDRAQTTRQEASGGIMRGGRARNAHCDHGSKETIVLCLREDVGVQTKSHIDGTKSKPVRAWPKADNFLPCVEFYVCVEPPPNNKGSRAE